MVLQSLPIMIPTGGACAACSTRFPPEVRRGRARAHGGESPFDFAKAAPVRRSPAGNLEAATAASSTPNMSSAAGG